MDEQKYAKDYIDEEVIYQTQSLKDLEFGSEQHARAVEAIERLQKLNLKQDEIDTSWDIKNKELDSKERELNLKEKELELREKELEETIHKNEEELAFKEKELDEKARESKWELIKGIGIGVFSVAVPAIVHCALTRQGFIFEETGSIGSNTMRGVQNAEQAFVKRHL